MNSTPATPAFKWVSVPIPALPALETPRQPIQSDRRIDTLVPNDSRSVRAETPIPVGAPRGTHPVRMFFLLKINDVSEADGNSKVQIAKDHH